MKKIISFLLIIMIIFVGIPYTAVNSDAATTSVNTWPGQPMNIYNSANNIYYFDIPMEYNYFIFSDGNYYNGQNNGIAWQTKDIPYSSNNKLYTPNLSDTSYNNGATKCSVSVSEYNQGSNSRRVYFKAPATWKTPSCYCWASDDYIPNSPNIPSDAYVYNGHSYKIYSYTCNTWESAKNYCKNLGGHLATITSAAENDAVYSYIVSKGFRNAYFGLHDSESEGVWKWVTNEPVSYTNWHLDEPNSDTTTEDYAMFYYKYPDGTWNDGDFSTTVNGEKNFICEWDTTVQTDSSDYFSPQNYGWSFVNGYEGFSYPFYYSIPEERYREVFGDEYVSAAKTSKKKFNSMMPSWGGNCYGMSVSAVAFYLGILDWSRYDKLYEDDFSTVNSYFSTLRHSLNNEMYTSSDKSTEITKLIERYQILQYGDQNGYRYGSNSTYSSIFGNYCTGIDNYESYRGWFKKTDTYSHLPNGSYIKDIYNKIMNTNIPLLISIKGSSGGHAMVIRTDKKPTLVNGWYRVYVYDPNHPYLSNTIVSQHNNYSLRYYHLNNLANDTYIELNINENKWRYYGGLNSSDSKDYWGCDANGNIKTYNISTVDGIDNITPELLIVYDISNVDFPTVFDGTNRYWTEDSDSATINITNSTNIIIKTTSGEEICEVANGMVLSSMDDVMFYPYEGTIDGANGFVGGKLIIPYTNFTIDYISGDDISILSNNNIISIATEQSMNIGVDTTNNNVDITGNENTEVIAKISNFGDDSYVGTYAQGTLGSGENLTLDYTDDTLTVTSTIESDNAIGIYSNNDSNETFQPLAVISNTYSKIEIDNISNIEGILKGDIDSNGVVSIMDVSYIQKYLTELIEFTNNQLAVADTNENIGVDILDATHLQYYLAELITEL